MGRPNAHAIWKNEETIAAAAAAVTTFTFTLDGVLRASWRKLKNIATVVVA